MAVPTSSGFMTIPLDEYKSVNADGKYEFMGLTEQIEAVPDRKSQIEGMKMLADIHKLRDKDIVINLPEPFIIKSQDGQILQHIGSKMIGQ